MTINEFAAGAAAADDDEALAWTLPGFDVSEWPEGPGGFGYGDADDATDLAAEMLNRAISIYTRQAFQASLPEAKSSFPNGDFEAGSFEHWTVTGSAWAIAATGQYGHTGASGSWYAESIAGGETATGVLRSPDFVLETGAVAFLIAGHAFVPGEQEPNHHNYVVLRLATDGRELDRIYAPGSDAFVSEELTSPLSIGQDVYLEVVDSGTDTGYAWLAVDAFVPVTTELSTSIDGFEDGSFDPLVWESWDPAWSVITSGQGFGSNPYEGAYCAKSCIDGNSATDVIVGELRSRPIEVPALATQLIVWMSGHDGSGGGAGQVYLDILPEGSATPLARLVAPGSESWVRVEADVSLLSGQRLVLHAVDARNEGFGWLGIDGIAFALQDPGEDQLRLTVDYDDGFVAYLNGYEMARRNLGTAGSMVAHDTAADLDHEAGTPEQILLPATRLRNGLNVLAIQGHNKSIGSTDLSLIADLELITTTGTQTLVRHGDPWKYRVGTSEPVLLTSSAADEDGDYEDWIELYNATPQPVALAGWSLTDDDDEPAKWIFPAVTLGAGQYLLVYASGKDRRVAGSPLHTNFKLDLDGEYLALNPPAPAQGPAWSIAPRYPAQAVNYSFGATGGADWLHLSPPTPGFANDDITTFAGVLPGPLISVEDSFQDLALNVALSHPVTGATIRISLDGSDPSSSSDPYLEPLSIARTTVLRARAYRPGYIPSPIATRTLIFGANEQLRAHPSLLLAGDPERSLYEPQGIMAIVGGSYAGGVWNAQTADDYNHPLQRGEAYERPVSFSMILPGNQPAFSEQAGIRISGSDFARPRYRRTAEGQPWLEWEQKFSFRLYFRDNYGADELEYPLFGDYPFDSFDVLTLRAGHNDHRNPAIRDELARRLSADTGNPASRGLFANLFINGDLKGFYNLCERLDENFYQTHSGRDNDWDVVKGTTGANDYLDGDSIAWNAMLGYLNGSDLSVLSSYRQAATMINVDSFIDYLLVNIYGATWDWPNNNWVAARERSGDDTRFIFSIWDAEGTFGLNAVTRNTITSDLQHTGTQISMLFDALMESPEFRLRFADRAQRHFFLNGALTDAHIAARHNELKAEVAPYIMQVYNEAYDNQIATSWIPQRRTYVFQHLRSAGLWPTVTAPAASPAGGDLASGQMISLSHANSTGAIFYTTNGTDPRAPGSGSVAVGATTYTGPIPVTASARLRARVRSGTTWSPLLEADYAVLVEPGAVIISEIMPNADGEDDGREWIELYNTTDAAIDLSGWVLADNDKDQALLSPGAPLLIAAGDYLVLGSSASPSANGGTPVDYAYGDALTLGNGGDEVILLRDETVIHAIGYEEFESAPHPVEDTRCEALPGYAIGMGLNYCEGAVSYWRMQETIYGAGNHGTPGADNDGVAMCVDPHETRAGDWENYQ